RSLLTRFASTVSIPTSQIRRPSETGHARLSRKTAAGQSVAHESPGEVDLTNVIHVKVPDIRDFKDVPIIEISVKPGDVVEIDDPLLTLESDKASMEVPSPSAGTVKEVLVKVGDRVGKDKLIVRLEGGDVPSAAQAAPAVMHQQEAAEPPPGAAPAPAPQKS